MQQFLERVGSDVQARKRRRAGTGRCCSCQASGCSLPLWSHWASVAGAGATVTSGDIVSTAAQPQSPFTTAIPFSSGQIINVVIPANSAFAAPDNTHGVKRSSSALLRTASCRRRRTACDGLTIQGAEHRAPTPTARSRCTGYTVYALPDSVSLGEGPGGPACGQTAATECILYIGEQPATTSPSPTCGPPPSSSRRTPPTAGHPRVMAPPPAVATVPDRQHVDRGRRRRRRSTADGVNSSTVTVTLLDAASVPVSGKTVTLTPACTPTPCSTHVTGPSPATTDGNGQTTFTVTDTAAQTVTLTAADPADSRDADPDSQHHLPGSEDELRQFDGERQPDESVS